MCSGIVASGISGAAAQSSDKGKAKGDPIVIGIYTPANNATFTAPELIDGAQAGVDYVNNELNGLGGRPLELVSCESDYTVPGLTACGNELFQQDPLIIIPGPDASALSVQGVFNDTGIPLIGGASFTPPEYTSPNRAMFNGFSASLFPAMVHFAVSELGAEKVTTMSVDVPSNSIIKSIFMDPIAETNGLPKPDFIGVPVGSADLTSYVAAALVTEPDVLLPFGLPCLPFFQAYESLGSDVPVIFPDNCSDKDTLSEAGDQADGMYFVSLYYGEETKKNKDVKLFAKKMKKYADEEVVFTSFSRSGFGTIMNIHALLDGEDPDALTHESVLAAFKAAADQPNFLNTPYNCASPPLPDYPAICAGSAFLVRQVKGKLKVQTDFITADVLYSDASG